MHNNTFDTGTHLCICSVLQDKCIKQSRANLLCKSWEIKRTSAKSFPRLIEVFHICGLDSSTINWCGLIYSFEFLSAKRALTFNSRKCDITMYYGHFRGIAVCLLIINVYCPDGLTNNIVLVISSIGMKQIKMIIIIILIYVTLSWGTLLIIFLSKHIEMVCMIWVFDLLTMQSI